VNEFFPYRRGQLHAEAVPLQCIADAVGTPFYIYCAACLTARYQAFAGAFLPLRPMVCYAVKANSNLAVLKLLAGLGAGADVVSEGELRRALAAGIPPERIVFSGVGKSREELAAALSAGIHQINVESVPELRRLSAIAAAGGRTARIAIRLNPDVDARTHAKIATGKKENKFGIDLDEAFEAFRLASELPGVEPVALAMHIGSQAGGLEPFAEAFERLAGFVRELRGAGFKIQQLDLGGGLSIRYRDEVPPEPAEYGALVKRVFGGLDVALAFEPGRVLVGPAGLLVSRVEYVKQNAGRRIVVLDAAMNDLIRPAMYEAWHEMVPVSQPQPGGPLAAADIVGPVCETGDTFGTSRELPPLDEDELVAFANAGAYGATMSSTYNSRLLVPEVLVSGERFAVIRARPTYDEMLALDSVPDWLG